MHSNITKIAQLSSQIDINNLYPIVTNNQIFYTIVNLILTPNLQFDNNCSIQYPTLFTDFPNIANQAKFELECSCQNYKDYLYLQNYKDLVKYEIQSLQSLGKTNFKNILFLGCGPMPISSHLYSQQFEQATITNLDKADKAIQKAKIHFPNHQFLIEDIKNITSKYLSQFDLVIIAAGIGDSVENKSTLIHNLLSHKPPCTTFLLRDSPGLSSILYFPVPIIPNHKVFDFASSKPSNIINSCKIIL